MNCSTRRCRRPGSTTMKDALATPTIDLDALGFDRGAGLLLERALAGLPTGSRLEVIGRDPALTVDLGPWCRSRGHRVEAGNIVVRGDAAADRWLGATRAGTPGPGGVVERPEPAWGLAARGALVEAGAKPSGFDLDDRDVVWADIAPRLYAQAGSSQWDPATAIAWDAAEQLPPEIEAAGGQGLTDLVGNQQAALVRAAPLLGR